MAHQRLPVVGARAGDEVGHPGRQPHSVVDPAASAPPTFAATRCSRMFRGVIAAMTPTGTSRTTELPTTVS